MRFDFGFSLADFLAMFLDDGFDKGGILFDIEFGFGAASGFSIESFDAFFLIAIEPTVDAMLGHL